MKKFLSLLLSMVMVLSCLSCLTVANVSAVTKTQDDAVNWANSQIGNYIDVDGAYGNQCVDLIMAYYEYLGVSRVSGHGYQYATNALPSGWTRIQNTATFVPEPGDIVVWGTSIGGGYGHVAIFISGNTSSFVSIDQNWPKGTSCQKVTHNYNSVWGVIRPNFSSQEPEDNYVDLGTDFYAMIANNNAGKAVGLDKDCNIIVEPYEGHNDQIWHFIKQSNGGYKIINGYTDTYIVGDNIASLEPEAGNNNKIWYIKQNQSGYALVHYSGNILRYLHPAYEVWNNGTQMTLNDSAAPLNINFVEGEGNKPTDINIITNNSYYTENPIKIEWTKSKFANYYNVTIWKDNGEKVVDTATRNNSILCNDLSTGHYGVYIDAENHIGKSSTAVYHFNVISSMEPTSFDAVITNRENYAITDSDEKLCVETYEVFNDQIWQFSFQDDGSYLIRNRRTGEFLSADKDNIYTSEITATKWFIGNQADKHYLYMVIGGNTYYLKIDWKANAIPSSSSEQSLYYLNIVKGEDNTPQKFDVDIPYGTISQNDILKITWSESKYSYYYDIEIKNTTGVSQISTAKNALMINGITEGLYEIKITAVNDIGQYSLEPINLLIKVVDNKIIISEPNSKLVLGDVDGDGEVTVLDATQIQRHKAEITFIADDRLEFADTDNDGLITILDATQIQRTLAQITTEF